MVWLEWLRAQSKKHQAKKSEGEAERIPHTQARQGTQNRQGARKKQEARTRQESLFDLDTEAIEDFRISGPYTSKNLSVFLIHGKDVPALSDFLTLEEALDQGKVIVEETGNVSELRIKNLSDKDVFVQSGDVVKGGRQDRALQFDMILTPESGFVPIKAFCVERGRWSRRGLQDVDRFTEAHGHVAYRSMKMAMKYRGDQHEVWREVHNTQLRSASNANIPLSKVQNAASPTSYQLTLETPEVQNAIQGYVDELSNAPNATHDVIGYAIAINGRVTNIDVYASNVLFVKMWMKLLKASALEALGELNSALGFEAPTTDQVIAIMTDANQEKAQVKAMAGQSTTIMKESKSNLLFETRDTKSGGSWVHRNYAIKQDEAK